MYIFSISQYFMFIRKFHNKALKGTKLLEALTVLAFSRVSTVELESELTQEYLQETYI